MAMSKKWSARAINLAFKLGSGAMWQSQEDCCPNRSGPAMDMARLISHKMCAGVRAPDANKDFGPRRGPSRSPVVALAPPINNYQQQIEAARMSDNAGMLRGELIR
jgi:hypothetical protein